MALSLYHPEAHAIANAIARPQTTTIHPIRVQNAITVADLRASMRQREETQRAGYGACLERCYSRVRRCASVGRTECVFQVPHAVAGMPLYDVGKCAKYVVAHLKRNGFRVTYGDTGEFDLRVSWDVGIQEATDEEDEADEEPQQQHPQQQQHQQPRNRQAPAFQGSAFGSAFGGVTRMSRDEQMRHLEYVSRQQQQQQPQPPAQHQPIPRPANRASPRSSSPPGFMRSIAEFKPSGKFVLRV